MIKLYVQLFKSMFADSIQILDKETNETYYITTFLSTLLNIHKFKKAGLKNVEIIGLHRKLI
jgi:hypothetical protein